MSPYQRVTSFLPPTPVGLFGHVYMVKLHDDQRTTISDNQHIPMKDTDKGTIAVHMGQHPLWPGAPQVLLPNGVITTRHLQSTALPVIPFGWTPKTRNHQPLLPHQPTTPSAGPIIQLSATPIPSPTTQPTSNLPIQTTKLQLLQDAISASIPRTTPPIPSPIVSSPATNNQLSQPPSTATTSLTLPPTPPAPPPTPPHHPPSQPDVPVTAPAPTHPQPTTPRHTPPTPTPPSPQPDTTTNQPTSQTTTSPVTTLPPTTTAPPSTRTTRHTPTPPGFYDKLAGNTHPTRRPTLSPPNQLQRASAFISALISKSINAVQRKSQLKQETMVIARHHLQSINPQAPTTNKPVLTQPTMHPEYYELHPPTQSQEIKQLLGLLE